MRRHLPIVCFVLLLLVNLICAGPARKPLSAENWSKKLRDGDIVFIRSRNDNSQLIADLSSPGAPIDADNVFTHCGIIFKQGGTPKVYEGAGRGEVLSLAQWQVSEANGGMLHNVYVRRWSRGDELTPQKLRIILDTAAALHYKPYGPPSFFGDANGTAPSDYFFYVSAALANEGIATSVIALLAGPGPKIAGIITDNAIPSSGYFEVTILDFYILIQGVSVQLERAQLEKLPKRIRKLVGSAVSR